MLLLTIFILFCITAQQALGALGVQLVTSHPAPRAAGELSAPSGPDDWHRVTGKRALTPRGGARSQGHNTGLRGLAQAPDTGDLFALSQRCGRARAERQKWSDEDLGSGEFTRAGTSHPHPAENKAVERKRALLPRQYACHPCSVRSMCYFCRRRRLLQLHEPRLHVRWV